MTPTPGPLARACALLLAFAVALAPIAATAQTADEREQARALSKAGAALFKAGDYAGAVEKFEAANALVPHPVLDINIGRCYEKLDDPTQALAYCKAALNSPGSPDKVREAARECVDRAQSVIGTRPVLVVSSRPKGAKVIVDGLEMGRTPWNGEVDAGRRQVDLELEGHRMSTTVVFAEFGKQYPVDEVLIPDTAGALITVTSVPSGATISLDGEVIGQTPVESYPLSVKGYSLEVTKPGFVSQVMQIELGDGQHLTRGLTLVPIEDPNAVLRARWPGWSMIGASAVAAGAAGLWGYWALEARQRADELALTSGRPEDRPAYESYVNQMEKHRLLSDILWSTSAALLAGGITWLAWPDE